MSDDIWNRDEVQSPCARVCVIHPRARLCVGCLRSIDEIANWSTMDAEKRRAIMTELPTRTSRLTQRRGGRAARIKTD